MKLRPTVLVLLLFLISPVSSGDELDQSQKLHRKTYMTSVEVMNYLAENLSLAWASVYGEVDVNYSIREQINNLALAKSKFEEFDRLLERYSDLKVTSKDGVKHKSIMLEQLYSSRPVLIEMIAQGDAVRLATESQDTVVLEKADVEFMRQSILHLESENASLSAAVYQIELWHPTLWLNQCIEASTGTKVFGK
jgi:hypothetical protein